VPPPKEVCDLDNIFHMYPTGDSNDPHVLTICLRTYKGRTVSFSIQQSTLVGDQWVTVARIDTKGGDIHRHQFDQADNDLWGHRKIKDIPVDDAWDTIEKGYQEALVILHDEWTDNLRRWSSGDAQ
jgi:hypothetical protein